MYLSQHQILNFSELYQIKYLTNSSIIDEFLSYIQQHKLKDVLLPNFSDIYLLIANNNAQFYINPNELNYKEILGEKSPTYKKLTYSKTIILGYMLVSQSINNPNVHFIEYIDNYNIPDLNITKLLISKYENYYAYLEIKVFPRYISKNSAEYWLKYFDNTSRRQIKNKLKDYNLRKEVDYEELYNLI